VLFTLFAKGKIEPVEDARHPLPMKKTGKNTMEMKSFVRKGLIVFGLVIAATLAVGLSEASAQGIRIGGGSVAVYGGHGGYIGGGYRVAPRRGVRVYNYSLGHYDYHPGGVHLDPVYHPTYGHWTPLRGYHTHGHYDLVPHYTPGHYDYHIGGHHHGHFHH
jgi:hypothetical protein